MGSQVEHLPKECRLGAQEGVYGRLVSTISPPDAVLLGCECQRDKVGGLEVARRGCGRKDAAAATEVSIFKA